MCLMIVGIYKMHIKGINIKNQASCHSGNLVNAKELETKNIVIDKESYNYLTIYFTRYFLQQVNKNV